MDVTFGKAPPLPGWLDRQLPFRRRAAEIDGRRVHFIDEGEGQPILLMHGNPTWSYLWRKVIARLRDRFRVVAPDLLGFGLSDKPRTVAEHTVDLHVRTMVRLVDALDLQHLVLVGQDWGGPVACGVGARAPHRVHGLVLANTSVRQPPRPFRPKAFHRLSHAPLISQVIFRGLGFPLPILDRVQGDRRSIGWREKAAYAWPLRRLRDRTAPLALARMVPTGERHPSTPPLDQIGAWVESWHGPAALVWGTRDPVLGRALRRHHEVLPQALVTETTAGHFLQEEVPDELAHAIAHVAAQHPAPRVSA
jgi:cis-3-alkyl-4-acyloxetan-2-one decarboxylase